MTRSPPHPDLRLPALRGGAHFPNWNQIPHQLLPGPFILEKQAPGSFEAWPPSCFSNWFTLAAVAALSALRPPRPPLRLCPLSRPCRPPSVDAVGKQGWPRADLGPGRGAGQLPALRQEPGAARDTPTLPAGPWPQDPGAEVQWGRPAGDPALVWAQRRGKSEGPPLGRGGGTGARLRPGAPPPCPVLSAPGQRSQDEQNGLPHPVPGGKQPRLRAAAWQAAWATHQPHAPPTARACVPGPSNVPVGRSFPSPAFLSVRGAEQDETKPPTWLRSHPELWPSPLPLRSPGPTSPVLGHVAQQGGPSASPAESQTGGPVTGRKRHRHNSPRTRRHVFTPAVAALGKRLLSTYCVPGRGHWAPCGRCQRRAR